MQPTDELYRQYAHVITAVVSRYSSKCPDLEDDLYLQAGLVFCQACLSYDPDHPSHASFKTYLAHKLHSITDLIEKFCNGPHALNVKGCNPVPLQIPADGSREDDMGFLYSPSYPSRSYLDKYSQGLVDYNHGPYPDKMQGTLDALEGDALQVFHDWCAGLLDKSKNASGVKKRRDERKTLNTMRIYRRRYMAMGWTFERTREAWEAFSRAFRPYAEAVGAAV